MRFKRMKDGTVRQNFWHTIAGVMSDSTTRDVSDDRTVAASAILTPTLTDLSHRPVVRGYDFNQGVDYERLLQSYATTGFQATLFSRAVDQINQMVSVLFLNTCILTLPHHVTTASASDRCFYCGRQ